MSNDPKKGRRRRRSTGKISKDDVVFPTISNAKRNLIIFGILIGAMVLTVVIIKFVSGKDFGSLEVPAMKK